MLHCIQIFTNTCEVTVKVKRVIGKATIHVILHDLMFVFQFQKLYYTASIPIYNVFPCVVNVSRSHVPVLLAMQ